MTQIQLYRHGDVALIPVKYENEVASTHRIQSVRKRAGRLVLAYGEGSGHFHAVEGMNAVQQSGGLVLEVPEGQTGTIKHLGYNGPREHEDIEVPAGLYIPVQQHEFDIIEGWQAALD